MRFGPTHTEVVLTAADPRLIETHLRVGGDEIWNLVTGTTGVDLVEYQLRQCVGEKVLPEVRAVLADPGRARLCEAIWFAAAPTVGELVEITGADGPYSDGVTVDVLGRPGTALSGLRNSEPVSVDGSPAQNTSAMTGNDQRVGAVTPAGIVAR